MGERAEAEEARGQLRSRPWRFLWWASLCSSVTSSSSLRARAEGASDSVHPQVVGPFLSCNRRVPTVQAVQEAQESHGTGASGWGCRYARRCATTGAGVQPVQAALSFHSCSALAVGVAAWREEGRRVAAFRPGVGAHHELN